jgi:hypothetical protein
LGWRARSSARRHVTLSVLSVLRPEHVVRVVQLFGDEAPNASGAEVVEEGAQVVGGLVELVARSPYAWPKGRGWALDVASAGRRSEVRKDQPPATKATTT